MVCHAIVLALWQGDGIALLHGIWLVNNCLWPPLRIKLVVSPSFPLSLGPGVVFLVCHGYRQLLGGQK